MDVGLYESEKDNYDTILVVVIEDIEFGPVFHSAWELLFVLEGEVSVKLNQSVKTVKSGDIVFVNSFDTHTYTSIGRSKILAVMIDESNLLEFKTYYNKVFENFISYKDGTDSKLFQIAVEYAENAAEADGKLPPLIKKGYANLILGILANTSTMVDEKHSSMNTFLRKVHKYLNEHYAEDISIEDVANATGYCRNYFSKLFNECIGQNFKSFLNQMRLSKVQQKLENNTSQTILSIASECGFNSLSSYYYALKKLKA